jgi:5-methylcytosine-specific restriction endonuclease McrA
MAISNAEACKRWRARHPDRQRRSNRKWREKNPGKAQTSNLQWNANNPGKAAESCKNWQKNNPEKYQESRRNWARNNRASVIAYNLRRRARRAGVDECFSAAQARLVLDQFNGKCFKCGSSEKLQIDHHLPLALGHPLEFGNAVILCRSCNASKRDRLPEHFYSEVELIALSSLLKEQNLWSGHPSVA